MIWIFTTVVCYEMMVPPSVCVCVCESERCDGFSDGSHIIIHPLISSLSRRSLDFLINYEITTIRLRPAPDRDRTPHQAPRHLSFYPHLPNGLFHSRFAHLNNAPSARMILTQSAHISPVFCPCLCLSLDSDPCMGSIKTVSLPFSS